MKLSKRIPQPIPIFHVPFWEGNVNRAQKYTTKYF